MLGISDEEAEVLAASLAKIVSAKKKRLREVSARLEKRGPWLTLILAVGAIYGPRLFMLWHAYQAQKLARKGPQPVTPIREDKPESTPASESQAVN